MPRFQTVEEKLAFAFEVWIVRPFELIRSSPDAADLFESTLEFAADVISGADAEFEAFLAGLLEPLVREQPALKLPPLHVARILRTSAKGFKTAARDAADLRRMIGEMRQILLLSLRV